MFLTNLDRTTDLSRFLSYACTTPLGLPAMLVLVDQWRFSFRTILRVAAGILVFLFGAYAVIYSVWGTTPVTLNLVAWGTPLICWAAFLVCCRFRDGRLLFSIITALLLAFATETLACMLAPHGSYPWLVYKFSFTGAELALLILWGRKPFQTMLHSVDTGWVRLSLLPFFLLCCLMSNYLIPIYRNQTYTSPLPTLLLCISILLIYFSLYSVVTAATTQNNMKRDMNLMHNQMHLLEQQARIMQANDHDNRIFRHNLRHFISMLQGCADICDVAGIQGILSSMETSFDTLHSHFELRNYTGQPVIDAVLSLCEEQAQSSGIAFTARLSLPPSLPVDIIQLSVVLSNALENALNACLNQPEDEHREIILCGECVNDQFHLFIQNTFSGEVKFDEATGFPLATRQGHGYGTHTITAFMNAYNVLVDFHTKGSWFYFSLLI